MLAPSPSDLSKEFSTAYFDASLAGAEMRNVAGVLETLRIQLAQAAEPYSVWAALYEQIGVADLKRFMPALVKLAGAFQSAVISSDVARLRRSFNENREKGWLDWLLAYAKSFHDAGWRSTYAAALAEQALLYPPVADWSVEKIQKAAQAAYEDRWPESYDWFLFLSGQDLPNELRARIFAMLAEIQIFCFFQPSKARTYLEKATELAPDLPLTRNAWGEYWTALGKWDDARKVFGDLVKAYPSRREGYVGMGDCDEKTGQLASAETWYYQAVLNAPGQATGYRYLIGLWLRPDQSQESPDLAKLESRIQPLLLRWTALVEKPATVPLSVGIAYKNAKRFEQARRSLEEALHLDPSSAVSYVWLGYTRMDEAAQTTNSPVESLYASAREDFNQAVRLAPGALDGYWAISGLYMQQQNWTAAEEWTNRCLPLHPEWESFVRVRRAEVLRQQGRLTEAEADVTRSLELESVNQAALDVMSSLVDDCRAQGQKESARRLLDQWKEKSDPAQAYLYYNRLANWSYESADYATAVDLYRQALQVKESDAVLHSNLARALQRLRTPGKRRDELREAIAEFERANRLTPSQELADKIAGLHTQEAFLDAYGEAAAAFDSVVDPIQAYIDWAVMPEILTGSNLKPETRAAVADLRARLRKQFGFVLPGVNFRDLQPSGTGKYHIVFNESTEYEGALKAGSVLNIVLGQLEELVLDRMAEFLGHDEAARRLKQLNSASATEIAQDAVRLTSFVAFLRSMLASRRSIEPLAGALQQFQRMAGHDRSSTPSTDAVASQTEPSGEGGQRFPRIVVKVGGPDSILSWLEKGTEVLPKVLFDVLGLPVPPIVLEHDATLPDRAAVLLLNGRQLSAMPTATVEAIQASLQAHADKLIAPEVTNCLLAKIKDRYPEVVRAARARLSLQDMSSYLGRRVAAGDSIKNLPGILEDELAESLTGEAWASTNFPTLPAAVLPQLKMESSPLKIATTERTHE